MQARVLREVFAQRNPQASGKIYSRFVRIVTDKMW